MGRWPTLLVGGINNLKVPYQIIDDLTAGLPSLELIFLFFRFLVCCLGPKPYIRIF